MTKDNPIQKLLFGDELLLRWLGNIVVVGELWIEGYL